MSFPQLNRYYSSALFTRTKLQSGMMNKLAAAKVKARKLEEEAIRTITEVRNGILKLQVYNQPTTGLKPKTPLMQVSSHDYNEEDLLKNMKGLITTLENIEKEEVQRYSEM